RRGFNVEATLQGTEGEKHLWVTAHLDSVYNAGASDDASGLVSILLTAKALKEVEPKHTIHFVAYDLEEIGLYGSSRYVDTVVNDVRKREGEDAIIGNINSDMIGYDEGGFRAVMGTCNQAGPLDDAVLRAREEIDSPIKLDDDCLARSDHQNFWDAGYPALILTDGTKYDDYPWYHETGDTVDKLNLPYLRAMIQLTAASTALLATPRSES
ncbi:MAG: M20/M25/M40 family metallo-hydrolase, partial [Actinomycetota bacterium]|nr:M20/M25/M40 family metallo-hydrolase [Actinomycetota bacterium]